MVHMQNMTGTSDASPRITSLMWCIMTRPPVHMLHLHHQEQHTVPKHGCFAPVCIEPQSDNLRQMCVKSAERLK